MVLVATTYTDYSSVSATLGLPPETQTGTGSTQFEETLARLLAGDGAAERSPMAFASEDRSPSAAGSAAGDTSHRAERNETPRVSEEFANQQSAGDIERNGVSESSSHNPVSASKAAEQAGEKSGKAEEVDDQKTKSESGSAKSTTKEEAFAERTGGNAKRLQDSEERHADDVTLKAGTAEPADSTAGEASAADGEIFEEKPTSKSDGEDGGRLTVRPSDVKQEVGSTAVNRRKPEFAGEETSDLDATEIGAAVARQHSDKDIRNRELKDQVTGERAAKTAGEPVGGWSDVSEAVRIASEQAAGSETESTRASSAAGSRESNETAKTTVVDLRDPGTVQEREGVPLDLDQSAGEELTDDREGELGFKSFRSTAVQSSGTERTDGSISGRSFGRMMRDVMHSEIVRQSSIILKNATQGEIKLVLKPEHLGNLRVRLQIDDHQITGRIIVDNQAVKDAVEQNLGDLARAFREQGFDTAALDVTVSGRHGTGGKQEQDNGDSTNRRGVVELDASTPLVASAYDEYQSTVNLVV